MTAARRLQGAPVRLEDLRVGGLLAEGGEGKVYQLPLQPHLVYKSYRRPLDPAIVEELVSWPRRALDTQRRATVAAAAAWPESAVLNTEGLVAGLLVPRAPKRYALRHRDGATRLATLSYLTTDPAHRAVAYGLQLPSPAGPERFGLVYALARLLEAFDAGDPRVGHGDLSTKNVLWSLQRGPEVFVIDCDNAERFDRSGRPLGDPGRRRAMTPNWDDPAVTRGSNPTVESDRYSLALIFLRVVGAANFPMQARQRSGEPISVDFPLPPELLSDALLGPGAPLWALCERGLSLSAPGERPPASAWVAALEAVLDAIGSAQVMRNVWAAQGGGRPSPAVIRPLSEESDVAIRPVPAEARPQPKVTRPVTAPFRARALLNPQTMATVRLASGGFGPPAPAPAWGVQTGGAPAPPAAPLMPEVRAAARRTARAWLGLHRRALRALLFAQSQSRGRTLALCAAIDVSLAIATMFMLAMLTSPFIGY